MLWISAVRPRPFSWNLFLGGAVLIGLLLATVAFLAEDVYLRRKRFQFLNSPAFEVLKHHGFYLDDELVYRGRLNRYEMRLVAEPADMRHFKGNIRYTLEIFTGLPPSHMHVAALLSALRDLPGVGRVLWRYGVLSVELTDFPRLFPFVLGRVLTFLTRAGIPPVEPEEWTLRFGEALQVFQAYKRGEKPVRLVRLPGMRVVYLKPLRLPAGKRWNFLSDRFFPEVVYTGKMKGKPPFYVEPLNRSWAVAYRDKETGRYLSKRGGFWRKRFLPALRRRIWERIRGDTVFSYDKEGLFHVFHGEYPPTAFLALEGFWLLLAGFTGEPVYCVIIGNKLVCGPERAEQKLKDLVSGPEGETSGYPPALFVWSSSGTGVIDMEKDSSPVAHDLSANDSSEN